MWLSLVALLAIVGCGKKAEPPPQEVVRQVKVLTLTAPVSAITRVYPGTVDAADTAMLAFQADGKVIELPVVAGQQVKQGDLLAKIDPREFEQAVAEAKAKHEEAERNAARYRDLFAKDAVSEVHMEKVVKEADVLRAQFENAKKLLQDTVLLAPFDGIVSQRLIENHQNVKAGDEAIRVQDIARLKVSIAMPEADIAAAPQGSRDTAVATAAFSAAPGQSFPLKVVEIEAEADQKTQTFRVKLMMDQPTGVNILPGMTAQVSLVFPDSGTQKSAATIFSVPAHAVISDESGAARVWVVDAATQTVRARSVTVGEVTGSDQLLVTGGLAAGETIALTGVGQLREGMKIRSVQEAPGK